MSYISIVVVLLGLVWWYGDDAMPAVGIIALVSLYFLVTELKNSPPDHPQHLQSLPLPV